MGTRIIAAVVLLTAWVLASQPKAEPEYVCEGECIVKLSKGEHTVCRGQSMNKLFCYEVVLEFRPDLEQINVKQ